MPQVQAFRGIRYDLAHVGSLRDVVAPPYDVIDAEMQDRLYKRHPCNVVRLILNREEPGDDDQENRYTRAARFFRSWLRQGVLTREADPALYVYQQRFDYNDQPYERLGVMARVRLEPFGQGTIYPHEETYPGPKQDRLKLMQACRANLSQIFGLVPDAEMKAGQLLAGAILDRTPLEAVDDLGVTHRVWPVTDVDWIQQVQAAYAGQPTFIADGHHRYETACLYRDLLAKEHGGLDHQHPANFVLMMLVGMSDPGMIVLPTHRLFRGLPPIDSTTLREKLSPAFECKPAGAGAERGREIWSQIETEARQDQIAFYTPKDDQWTIATLTTTGHQRMAQRCADRTPRWRSLGVALLHHLVMDDLLDAQNLPRPEYVHDVGEVVEFLQQASPSTDIQLAALVMPATVDDIRTLSLEGERMPQKSTYFYPKLLSGLVFNPLEP